MKYLLDTHIFLWAIVGDPRLKRRHRTLFLDEESELYLSVVSFWEMLIKTGLGKLQLPQPAAEFLEGELRANHITLLPVRLSHLAELEQLPPLHKDPFDRMLVAQALAEKLCLLSEDNSLRSYGVRLG